MGGHVLSKTHAKVVIYIVAISPILKMSKINNNITRLEIYAFSGKNVVQNLEVAEYLVCEAQLIILHKLQTHTENILDVEPISYQKYIFKIIINFFLYNKNEVQLVLFKFYKLIYTTNRNLNYISYL